MPAPTPCARCRQPNPDAPNYANCPACRSQSYERQLRSRRRRQERSRQARIAAIANGICIVPDCNATAAPYYLCPHHSITPTPGITADDIESSNLAGLNAAPPAFTPLPQRHSLAGQPPCQHCGQPTPIIGFSYDGKPLANCWACGRPVSG